MPATAPLEDLQKVNSQLQELEKQHPDAYKAFAELFKGNRKVGYKNICKLLLGESSPEELKGLK